MIKSLHIVIFILLILTCICFLIGEINPIIATLCLISWTITGFNIGKDYERSKGNKYDF